MLQLKDISKEYHTGNLTQRALDHVSVSFRDNEFVAILGPSGSGKTTMLNIIGGLDRYDSGDLIIGGVSTKRYKDRDWDSYRNHTIGFVFQSYNLIMHQNVLSNVELALTISGVSKSERRKRAEDALRKVGLGEQMHKLPNQMSGGQMQRVAIARALVNDPDIVLADEPTGALDSETSVQVMNLLKEVAKDRLVVMVTHNPELAKEYATRIVNIKDGRILSDTDPYIPDTEEKPVHKNMGKSSMSFLTALSLSFNNLKTKKARTILVAFAGSIGIIGIALILSLSTGVNRYIRNIESQTLSEYPLQIQKSGFSLASFMSGDSSSSGTLLSGGEDDSESSSSENSKSPGEVRVMNMVSTLFSRVSTNDLESLKTYLDSGESDIDDYVSSIEYEYDITPYIYRVDPDHSGQVLQLNPSNLFDSMSSQKTDMTSFSGSMTTMMSNAMNSNYFYSLPSSEDLYKSQYEVVAGTWPKSSHDLTLVLSEDGDVSDVMLYGLGIRSRDSLNEMLKQYEDGEEVHTDNSSRSYSYSDFLGLTMKMVLPSDLYQYDEELKIWQNKSDDTAFLSQAVSNGEDLTITGIIRPKEGTQISMLQMGIAYPESLVREIMEKSAQSEIVKEQMESPDQNVLTGNTFEEDNESNGGGIDLSQLFSVDEDALKKAFNINSDSADGNSFDLSGLMGSSSGSGFDLSALNGSDGSSAPNLSSLFGEESGSSFDTSAIANAMQGSLSDTNALSGLLSGSSAGTGSGTASNLISADDLKDALSGIKITATPETVAELFQKLGTGFQNYAAQDPSSDYTKLGDSVKAYLYSDQAAQIVEENLQSLLAKNQDSFVTADELTQILTGTLSGYPEYVSDNNLDPENFSENLQAYLEDEESGAKAYLEESAETIKGKMSGISLTQDDLTNFAQALYDGYDSYAKGLHLPQVSEIAGAFADYLKTDEAETLLISYAGKMVDTDSLESAVTAIFTKALSSGLGIDLSGIGTIKDLTGLLQGSGSGAAASQLLAALGIGSMGENLQSRLSEAMQTMMGQIMEQMAGSMEDRIQSSMQDMMSELSDQMQDLFQIDPSAFSDAITMKMSQSDLEQLFSSLLSSRQSSYEQNLSDFGYADPDDPTEIDIYPKDFNDKEQVTKILDDYNSRMKSQNEDSKVITYTDMVATMMSSVTRIINTISYVLIAFVAISLVVSSIMIGVITYISVLERRKEIGILRAIGASKNNVAQVFNAETFITGLLAGLIGIGITLILIVPINHLIHTIANQPDINAVLPLTGAAALIALSVLLTLLAGLIPSRKAAKSDPVTALRTE